MKKMGKHKRSKKRKNNRIKIQRKKKRIIEIKKVVEE